MRGCSGTRPGRVAAGGRGPPPRSVLGPCGTERGRTRGSTCSHVTPRRQPGGITAARPTSPRAANRARVGIDATSSGVRPSSAATGRSAQPSGTHTTYFTGAVWQSPPRATERVPQAYASPPARRAGPAGPAATPRGACRPGAFRGWKPRHDDLVGAEEGIEVGREEVQPSDIGERHPRLDQHGLQVVESLGQLLAHVVEVDRRAVGVDRGLSGADSMRVAPSTRFACS